MEQDISIARKMLPVLDAGSARSLLDRTELCLAQAGSLKVCYAPFDHIETRARLVVVGITPGMAQAVNALNAAWSAVAAGLPVEAVLAKAKLTASFSGGTTRSNLVAMLDAIGVAQHFGLPTAADLFRPGSTGIHFTSALRYPVFVDGKNYNGNPNMLKTPILRKMIETHLAEEADLLPDALWLPLGPKAAIAVNHLVDLGRLKAGRVLSGMPHPSGANGEPVALFLGRKDPADASVKAKPEVIRAAFQHLHTQISSLKDRGEDA